MSHYDNKCPPTKSNAKDRRTAPPVTAIGSPARNHRHASGSSHRSIPKLRSVAIVGNDLSQNRVPSVKTHANEQSSKLTMRAPSQMDTLGLVRNELPREEHPRSVVAQWINPKVQPLPKHYQLERSTVLLKREEFDMDIFTKNMVSCFRALSIYAKYYDDPASVSLRTIEYVEMHVSIWLTGRTSDEIAVEVQRRRGCPLTFHNYAQVILDTARGKTDASEHWKSSAELDLRLLLEAEKLLLSQDGGEDLEASWSTALQVTQRLVTDDSMDKVIAGLQSLCVMTDARKIGISTAAMFSKAILLGVTPCKTDQKRMRVIRDILVSLLEKKDNMEIFNDFKETVCHRNDESMSESEDEVEVATDFLFNLALGVLSNALELMLATDGYQRDCSFGMVDQVPCGDLINQFLSNIDMERDTLLSNLVKELGRAKYNPHNACLCAKCLTFFCYATETQLFGGNLKASAIDATKEAYQFGLSFHAKLQNECFRLWRVLITQ